MLDLSIHILRHHTRPVRCADDGHGHSCGVFLSIYFGVLPGLCGLPMVVLAFRALPFSLMLWRHAMLDRVPMIIIGFGSLLFFLHT